MDLSPAGNGRMLIALIVIGLMALSAWFTLDAGKYRELTLILLGFFAFRIVLGRWRAR